MTRRWVNAVSGGLLLLLLAFGVEVQTNHSVSRASGGPTAQLNPDAKLYYGLALNLLGGSGYQDTVRHTETLPPVGHPLWLAGTRLAGWSADTQARIAVWGSVLLVALGVALYARQLAPVLVTVGLYALYLRDVVWLAGNVETTIVLCQGLLVASLALFHRRRFGSATGALSGLALAATLLVRPMYLYALHAVTLLALAAWAHQVWQSRSWTPPAGALRGVLALVFTAQALMAGAGAYSEIAYGDTRLVSGTYSAYPLYLGNSPHLDTDRLYLARTRQSPEFDRIRERFETGDQDWEARERELMALVLDYWKRDPLRALGGFAWRLQHSLGFHGKEWSVRGPWHSQARAIHLWGPWIHPCAVILLLGLTGGLLCVFAWVGPARRSLPSLGLVLSLLFALYVATHSVFALVSFRYVTGSIPLLAAGIAVLGTEIGWVADPRRRVRP